MIRKQICQAAAFQLAGGLKAVFAYIRICIVSTRFDFLDRGLFAHLGLADLLP